MVMSRIFICILLFCPFFSVTQVINEMEVGGDLYVLAVSGLNLRESPDLNGKVVAKVPFGQKVKFLEDTGQELTVGNLSGHWTKVQYQGKVGYLFDAYL